MPDQENIVMQKCKEFSLRIIKLYRYVCSEHKEFILSKQIMRSGTSIGANVVEAQAAQSAAVAPAAPASLPTRLSRHSSQPAGLLSRIVPLHPTGAARMR